MYIVLPIEARGGVLYRSIRERSHPPGLLRAGSNRTPGRPVFETNSPSGSYIDDRWCPHLIQRRDVCSTATAQKFERVTFRHAAVFNYR
jgi:hypothetical protein